MRNLIKTFLVMLMLSFSHAAIAGDFEDGVIAYDKGDFETALRLWTPLAEQGSAEAQLRLGIIFAYSMWHQNYKTAVKWYILAAEQGNVQAQKNLASAYEKGQVVAQDYVKAHMWYSIAAVDGETIAINSRDRIAKKMTLGQIEKAQEAATRCIKQNFKNCD